MYLSSSDANQLFVRNDVAPLEEEDGASRLCVVTMDSPCLRPKAPLNCWLALEFLEFLLPPSLPQSPARYVTPPSTYSSHTTRSAKAVPLLPPVRQIRRRPRNARNLSVVKVFPGQSSPLYSIGLNTWIISLLVQTLAGPEVAICKWIRYTALEQ